MRHVDLFSGIGGFALAAGWAGFTTVLFCEIDPYCRSVLERHWPGVPVHDDVRTLTAEHVPDGGIDLLTGGFPCQPTSLAGQRRGAGDDRWLWPAMLRVIEAVQPRWVCVENPDGLVSLGLDGVLADLETAGYETGAVVLPAASVGAPHIRQRVFVVAHAGGGGRGTAERDLLPGQPDAPGRGEATPPDPQRDGSQGVRTNRPTPRATDRGDGEEVAADADGAERRQDLQGRDGQPDRRDHRRQEAAGRSLLRDQADAADAAGGIRQRRAPGESGHPAFGHEATPDDAPRERLDGEGYTRDWWPELAVGGWWEAEPAVRPLDDGVSGRVAALRALGNAVVPHQVYPVLAAIAAYERGD